jgi:hypothetical protein
MENESGCGKVEVTTFALKESQGHVSEPTGAAASLATPRSTLESKIRS